jgi:hypothetical protein
MCRCSLACFQQQASLDRCSPRRSYRRWKSRSLRRSTRGHMCTRRLGVLHQHSSNGRCNHCLHTGLAPSSCSLSTGRHSCTHKKAGYRTHSRCGCCSLLHCRRWSLRRLLPSTPGCTSMRTRGEYPWQTQLVHCNQDYLYNALKLRIYFHPIQQGTSKYSWDNSLTGTSPHFRNPHYHIRRLVRPFQCCGKLLLCDSWLPRE